MKSLKQRNICCTTRWRCFPSVLGLILKNPEELLQCNSKNVKKKKMSDIIVFTHSFIYHRHKLQSEK